MANPQHLEWLSEGVEAWNARRAREDFRPEFQNEKDLHAQYPFGKILLKGADLRDANFSGTNLEGADLEKADLRGAYLGDALLRKANLRHADFRRANLTRAVCEAADFTLAILTGVDLTRVALTEGNFVEAVLTRANLREAYLGQANLRGADLGGANLREAVLSGSDLHGADLTDADVRTEYSMREPHEGYIRSVTDLGNIINLTQDQLSTMNGDRGVILPDGLEYPPFWPEPEPPRTDPEFPTRKVSSQLVKAKLRENRPAVILAVGSVLEQVSAFREDLRGNNLLAAKQPELRESLIGFLDSLSADLDDLLDIVPSDETPVTEDAAEQAASWLDRFGTRLRINAAEYVHPDNVADAALPLGIILGCGAIGALLGGTIGFGAGSLVGSYITNNIKPGAVADEIEKLLEQDGDNRL